MVKKKEKKAKKKPKKKDSSKNTLDQLEKFFSNVSKAIEKFLFSPKPEKNKFKYKILNIKKQKNTSRKKKLITKKKKVKLKKRKK